MFIQPMSVQIKNSEASGKYIYKLVFYLKSLILLPLKCLFQISIQFIPQFPWLPLLFDPKATGTERTLKSSK